MIRGKIMRKIKYLIELIIIISIVLALVLPSSAVVTNKENTSGVIKNKISSCTKVLSKDGEQRGSYALKSRQ